MVTGVLDLLLTGRVCKLLLPLVIGSAAHRGRHVLQVIMLTTCDNGLQSERIITVGQWTFTKQTRPLNLGKWV